MKFYSFSPIKDIPELLEAVAHIHRGSYELCQNSFGYFLPNSGNIGVFCHYQDEFEVLTKIREQLTEPSDNPDQKYYKLHEPIVIPADNDFPEATYTHLYIRKPDPYRHHAGDVDFYLEPEKYAELKQSLLDGAMIRGARVFPRDDLDMIELHNPDIDVLAYVSQKTMAEKARIKIAQV